MVTVFCYNRKDIEKVGKNMKILAMDTSNATLAVAVHEDHQLLGQIQTTVNKNHSISLMPAIDQLMQMVNVKPTDLDRIVVAQGPGSYTGLRIGVTTAKTLADTLNIDLVGVSSLKVLAANCVNISEIIVPIFDARRKNVYAQAFIWQDDQLVEVMPAGHYPIVEVLAHFKDQAIYLVGKDVAKFTDEIAQYAPQAKVNTIENWQYPSASILAQLGCTQTPVADVASFLPTYLKLVEAEGEVVADPRTRKERSGICGKNLKISSFHSLLVENANITPNSYALMHLIIWYAKFFQQI